ncbi:MAG: hypothetical protein CM1200mP39_10050 [Dehalococcoidia bacterium]|nr:MAG: hypothetical protein CM1200mP39_10050 [Dehalococcoidia bacterium]
MAPEQDAYVMDLLFYMFVDVETDKAESGSR